MNVITKLKYCIYDGYRNNLLMKVGQEYRTANGIKVSAPTIFRENEKKAADDKEFGFIAAIKPKTMVYKELSIKYNHKTAIFDVIVDRVSTCDGFVSVDPDFCI